MARAVALAAALLGLARARASELALARDVALRAAGPGWAVAAVADLDGDGRADLVWRREDDPGVVRLWLLDGARGAVREDVRLSAPGPGFGLAAVGDADGDGRADLVWTRPERGDVRLSRLAGGVVLEEVALPAMAPGWAVAAAGDLDGDGRVDLVWRREDGAGAARVWSLDGADLRREVTLPPASPGWKVVGVGDVDGDGRVELAWRREDDSGEVRVWWLDGATVLREVALPAVPAGWKVAALVDVDGDGRADVVWRRLDDGDDVRVWLLDGGTLREEVGLPPAEPGWRVAGAGDLDGNRRGDLAWVRLDGSGEARLWLLARASDTPVSLPMARFAQEADNWCWAASGQMITTFLGHPVSQCEQAGARLGLGPSTCCNLPRCSDPWYAHRCNGGGTPEFWRWGFRERCTFDQALSLGQLATELLAGRPVAFTWGWVERDGSVRSGHMMVAKGLHFADGVAWVEVLDPWKPCGVQGERSLITYETYVAGPDHVHRDDHFDIRWAPGHGLRSCVRTSPTWLTPGAPGLAEERAATQHAPGPAPARTAPRRNTSPSVAALQALFAARAAVPHGVPGLGLGEEAREATVGAPLRDQVVGLLELSGFSYGASPELVLRATGEVLVPVLVRGEVRLAVTLLQSGAGWIPTAIGREDLARRVTAAASRAPVGAGEPFLVRIPALHVELAAWRERGELVLQPLFDDPRLGLSSTTPLPATAVFQRLAPVARRVLEGQAG